MKRWFWVLDVVAVVSFVIFGAADHGFELNFARVMGVSAPFLVALAAGIGVLRVWRKPLSILNGVLLSLITFGGGMLLRHFVLDEGTARIFLIVAGAYFFATMVGWRLIGLTVRWLRSRS